MIVERIGISGLIAPKEASVPTKFARMDPAMGDRELKRLGSEERLG